MNIGILTYHKSCNYGAFLQAYALQHSLQRDFPQCNVEIIDFHCKSALKYNYKRMVKTGFPFHLHYYFSENRVFSQAQSSLKLSQKSIITDDIEAFRQAYKGKYDVIVVGSDQVWVTDGFRGFPNAYWLPGDFNAVKISYAASSRSNLKMLSEENQLKLKQYIEDFRYIGVRDDSTLNELKNIACDKEDLIHINCDPVFTWFYDEIKLDGKAILKEKFGIDPSKKTYGVMLSPRKAAEQIIDELAGRDVNIVAFHYKQKKAFNAVLTPFEWLAVIRELDGMVTSFFHGMCFCLKFNIPFIAIEERRTTKERSKLFDMLNRIHEEYRYANNPSECIQYMNTLFNGEKPDFSNKTKMLYESYENTIDAIKAVVEKSAV